MERNNKDQANINEFETKKTIQRINETKSWFFEEIKKINKHYKIEVGKDPN
jgi:hypothetical protein